MQCQPKEGGHGRKHNVHDHANQRPDRGIFEAEKIQVIAQKVLQDDPQAFEWSIAQRTD